MPLLNSPGRFRSYFYSH